jgi:hypothetical protein
MSLMTMSCSGWGRNDLDAAVPRIVRFLAQGLAEASVSIRVLLLLSVSQDNRAILPRSDGADIELQTILDPWLRFARNYATGLRPYADYCEEQITLLD